MVQRVTDDGVFRSEQGLEQAAVGVKTGRVKNRVFGAEKGADAFLEGLVNRLRPADKPDRRHTIAVLVKRLVGSGNDLGVIGEAQVVVRAEVQDLFRVAIGLYVDGGLLGSGDQALLLVEPLCFECFGLLRERCEEGCWHGNSRWNSKEKLYRESAAIPMPETW